MIPVIHVKELSIARAWVQSINELINSGMIIDTEYEEASPSIDATAIIEVHCPTTEPIFPKFMPCGIDGLVEYAYEVIFGIKDDKIGSSSTAWTYTYHDRLASHFDVNQFQYVVDKLVEAPYTRRAIAITWSPAEDEGEQHPPCLQRLFFRLIDAGDCLELCMNVHMRSNDALMAAYMNMYAFNAIQKAIADLLNGNFHKPVTCGSYIHIADSYHIYGSRRDDGSLDRFLKMGHYPYLNHVDIKDIIGETAESLDEKYQEVISESIFRPAKFWL